MRSREHAWSMTDRTRRGITLSWLVLFVLSIMLQYGTLANPNTALAVHDEDLFELDGNALDDVTVGDDWENVYDGSHDADSIQFITDPVDDDADETFTGGTTTKDFADVDEWLWSLGKAPIKNDITHAFAAAYHNADDHLIAYFGLSKFSADGNNYAGFWFFQNPVARTGDGSPPGSPFSGVHADGDLLVLANYTNGGTLAAFDVFEWVGTGGDVAGHPELNTVASGVPCAPNPGDFACGATNGDLVDSPWPYQGDGPHDPPNEFLAGAFFEGGIDLTELGLDEGCFTSFLAETRSSQSIDAVLKDFALGSFDTCGSVTIVKDAIPNDAQDFTFGGDLGAFSLDDDATLTPLPSSVTFNQVEPGSYDVSELNIPANWALTGLTCDDGSSDTPSTVNLGAATATINVDPVEDVTCTFTNTRYGRILVTKQTLPDGSPQSFEFDPSWGTNFNLTDGQTNDSGFLAPGQYSVDEVNIPDGWDLTSATCDQGETIDDIDLGLNETVTCTFNNMLDGRILVDKITNPSGSLVEFEFQRSYGGNFFLADEDPLHDSGFLDPGQYSVVELVQAGWDLSSVSCSDGSLNTAIDLSPGEVVTCTFNNREDGKIIVVKQTTPDGSTESFEFDSDYGSNFFLTDGQSNDSGFLDPGTYAVDEVNLPAGWDMTGATCSDDSPIDAINLGAGEVVTCTFNNRQDGRILIDKVTNPSGDPATFTFDSSYGADFGLTDAMAMNDSGFLTPGTYTVTELALAGWDLTGMNCVDPTTNSSVNLGSATATINLGAGETVTCTFTNTKRGHIIVVKETLPDGAEQSFEFDSDYGSNFFLSDGQQNDSGALTPGTYSVSEIVPDGWDQTGASCDDESAVGSIGLSAGETVTCTFQNTQRGTIIVEKQTSPDGSTDEFDFTGDASGTISDGGQIVVSDLVPGTYTSTESDPTPDYDLTSIICDDAGSSGDPGTRTATFDLDPGETITCVFTNVQRGTITIIKDAQPNDAQDFGYDIDGFDGPIFFELDDDGDAANTLSNMETFENVPPGDYQVTEGIVAGWDLSDLDCVTIGGSSAQIEGATANLTMVAGGSITCTYVNSKPSISIVKTAGTAADGGEFVTEPGNVTYHYVVTNTGPIALSGITVRDDNGTPANLADDFNATCPKTTLAAGESMECTATVAVSANRTNIATTTGTSDGGTTVQDSDDALVRVPGLVIDKSYVGNTGGTAVNGTGIAKVGDTLTYTLAYDLTNGPVTHGIITDTLPNGLAYVAGSASTTAPFTTVNYDAATRTLTWTATTVSTDGTVSYRVTVLDGSFNLPQPLVNTATIDSDETSKDDDTANVLVQVVLAATATPVITLPPTDTIHSGDQAPSNPGFGLMLALLVLAGFGLAVGYFTPTPARARREEVRRR